MEMLQKLLKFLLQVSFIFVDLFFWINFNCFFFFYKENEIRDNYPHERLQYVNEGGTASLNCSGERRQHGTQVSSIFIVNLGLKLKKSEENISMSKKEMEISEKFFSPKYVLRLL